MLPSALYIKFIVHTCLSLPELIVSVVVLVRDHVGSRFVVAVSHIEDEWSALEDDPCMRRQYSQL